MSYCANCGNENDGNSNFCKFCGKSLNKNMSDLHGVTKIPSVLYVLFSILTLSIYNWVKWFRITCDINNLVAKERNTSLLVVTALFLVNGIGGIITNAVFSVPVNTEGEQAIIFGTSLFVILSYIAWTLVYCYVIYTNLKNLGAIAEANRNKKLRYNRFWAFCFGFLYINFVFNTYEKRLCD